jgi:hypothetical protein
MTLTDAVLLPEGGSDVAACLTLGLCAVGRPNNVGGVEQLGELLCVSGTRGQVIVLGENDRKGKDGSWPGLDGAQQTAQGLADRWRVSVAYALPGDG